MSSNARASNLNANELFNLALYANQNNQPGQAIEHLKALLQQEPENGPAHYLLGATHAEIGMYDLAASEMETALQHAPQLSSARFQLGLLYLTSGLLEKAEQTWQELSSLNTDDPYYHFCKGLLELANDKFEDCIRSLSKGIDINQHNQPLNNDMQMMIGEAKKALESNSMDTSSPEKEDSSHSGKHVLLNAYQNQDEEQTHE